MSSWNADYNRNDITQCQNKSEIIKLGNVIVSNVMFGNVNGGDVT